MSAGEAAEVVDPVVRGRLGLEPAQDPVQERVDELLLGREVVVERHRHGAEPGRDGAHRERVETLCGHLLGSVEDDVGRQRAATAPRAVRLG